MRSVGPEWRGSQRTAKPGDLAEASMGGAFLFFCTIYYFHCLRDGLYIKIFRPAALSDVTSLLPIGRVSDLCR